jgi:hypothetical protein
MLNDQLTLEIVVQKDMLALEDLRKLSHLISNSVTFFGAEAKALADAGRARRSFR